MNSLDSIIPRKYEVLLKKIYGIPLNSTTLHFTHGAHADVFRGVIDYSWVSNKDEKDNASYDDILNYGLSLGETSAYLGEALHFAITNLQVSPNIAKELEQIYSSLPASDLSGLCAAVEKSCELLQIDCRL